MNLFLTEEEVAFREEIGSWIRAHLPTDIADKVKAGLRLGKDDFQRWAKIIGKKGWLSYQWPQEFGGPGWTPMQRYLFDDECALAGAPAVMPFGPKMVAPVIMRFGSAAQQQRFLPGIASGEVWWSQGFSEPGSGSDLASLSTKAERRGDHFVVTGQKAWSSYAQYGDWIFCLVRVFEDGQPLMGLGFLLIDLRSKGVSIRPVRLLSGEAEVNEVWFDGVEVPADNLIGDPRKGWEYAQYLLGLERANIADVPNARRSLLRLKQVAKVEQILGDVRFRDEVAKLEADLVALELLVLKGLAPQDSRIANATLAPVLKIRSSQMQQRCAELLMIAGGPHALPRQTQVMNGDWAGGTLIGERYWAALAPDYLNLRKTSIYGGTNEIQKNIIANVLLG